MAEPLDVAARLADGRPAVDNVGDYVWACHLLGYQNPDLTAHSAQVRDWYSSEDGLDLPALEADRGALESVAAAADGAQRLQEQQLQVLTDAWQGRGGEASREFLLRHGEASAAAALAVRNAVDVLATLREDLWRAVDDKVATAIEIEDRRHAQRPEWQAATQTVTSGGGDRVIASETVDQQVKPFVDNDIRGDWLTAMQKAMAAVSAAFDAATAALTAEPPALFDVPADLGPLSTAAPASVSGPGDDAASTAPAGWTPPVSPPSPVATAEPSATPMPAPAPLPATAPAAALPSTASPPSLGEMGGGVLPGGPGGLTGGTGGLGGLASQLAEAIGSLFDSSGGELADPPEVGAGPISEDELNAAEDDVEDAEDVEDTEDTEDADGAEKDEETDEETEDAAQADEAAAEPIDDCEPEAPAGETPSPESTPPPPAVTPPSPPIAEPPPEAKPLGAETPCEIAADELPQAGP